MRLNVFRNTFIDAQIGYFLDIMIDARRAETEEYWRNTIAKEVAEAFDIPIDFIINGGKS